MIATVHELAIDIGGIPILVRTDSSEFADMIADRYGEFVSPNAPAPEIELEIRIVEQGVGGRESGVGTENPESKARSAMSEVGIPNSQFKIQDSESLIPNPQSLTPSFDPDADLTVSMEQGIWVMERGDFRAEWDPETKRGWVRTSVNQYSIDGVLRILHSLILAREGGLLVHGASVVRNGRAFVFAGISGTGKTTISRLAPPDVTLLTDEISYIRENKVSGARCQVSGREGRRQESGATNQEPEVRGPESAERISDSKFKIQDSAALTPDTRHLTPVFSAFGTPFAGELARIGVKTEAPLAGLFLLQQGPENRIEPVTEGQAVRELMRHILFFAHDSELVELVFQTVCDFVKRVPVKRLVFKKDASVWELIT